MKKIILHADDFGFDGDSCKATIELFDRGILSSASIMPTCEAAEMALDYARNHPQFSFGVHLTFVDGLKPASKLSEISSLVDEFGLFPESNIIRKKGLLLKLSTQEIINEINAQKLIVEDAGVPVSHLDSHGHLHKFPSFLFALRNIKKHNKKLKVRRVQNMFIKPVKNGPTKILNCIFDFFIGSLFKTTDYFYMPANSFDTNWTDAILLEIDKCKDGSIIEIGVHPGHNEVWRQHEYDDIIKFHKAASQRSDIEIISWKDV